MGRAHLLRHQVVSELIEIAGGEDVFEEKSHGKLASEREIRWSDVVERDPEIIMASWCGKPVDVGSIRNSPVGTQLLL